MVLHAVPSFSELDREQFESLIRIDSSTVEGQQEKALLVRRQVEERIAREQLRMKKLLVGRGFTERDAEDESVKKVNDVHYVEVPVPELGRDLNQLVIARGDTAFDIKKRSEAINIFVPAHIDTVPYRIKEQLSLHYDPSDTDKMIARGVYDMHAGVHASIVLASEISLPPGVNVFFAFTFDEELRSKGAKAMIEWMEKNAIWKDIDIVLSGEIGHLDIPEGDDRMRYIMGRRGRLKYRMNISVDEASTGHFAERHIRSASMAQAQALVYLSNRNYGTGEKEPLLRTHPKFGDPETLQFGNSKSEQKGSPSESPTQAESYYNILAVPGRTKEDSLEEQRMVLEEIKMDTGADKHRITYRVEENPHETSYEGYAMPENHALAGITENVLTRISGGAVAAYAPSVADETLYSAALHKSGAEHFRGVITIPPVGDNAHRIDEWVSTKSIVRMREAMRLLLESGEGFGQLSKYKKGDVLLSR